MIVFQYDADNRTCTIRYMTPSGTPFCDVAVFNDSQQSCFVIHELFCFRADSKKHEHFGACSFYKYQRIINLDTTQSTTQSILDLFSSLSILCLLSKCYIKFLN